jgi:protein ImuA
MAAQKAAFSPVDLDTLRRDVLRLERGRASTAAGSSVSLNRIINQALPGSGLARAAFHEVLAADPGAVVGFSAVIMARAAGPVVWIGAEPDIWPNGVREFGLSATDLVLVGAKRAKDQLWAFEEALRSPGVAGATLVLDGPPSNLIAARRLQLAAEAGGTIGLLILPDTDVVPPSAARSRWRVGSAPGPRSGDPCWYLSLMRISGGRPATWTISWDRSSQELLSASAGQHHPAGRPVHSAP